MCVVVLNIDLFIFFFFFFKQKTAYEIPKRDWSFRRVLFRSHPVRDDGVVRPLLDLTRAEIDAFLRERGIVARIDKSNADPRFLRNRIRAMLPESAIDNLAAVANQARAQWRVLDRAIDDADKSITTADKTIFQA